MPLLGQLCQKINGLLLCLLNSRHHCTLHLLHQGWTPACEISRNDGGSLSEEGAEGKGTGEGD